MNRNRLAVYAILLAAIFVVSACGGGGGGSTPPTTASTFVVTGVQPYHGATSIDPETRILVSFSRSILRGTVDEESFLLEEELGGARVPGSIDLTSENRVAVFAPDAPLKEQTRYRVRVLPTVSSLSSTRLGEEHRSTFRTGTSGPAPPPPDPDPVGRIRKLADLNVGRSSHTSTLLSDGGVLVAGGFRTSATLTVSAEIFSLTSERFTETPGDLSPARGFHTATRLTDGRVLLTGGVAGATVTETNSTQIFDPGNGFFAASGSMVFARAFHTATLLPDGRVLIAGGTVPGASGTFSSQRAEVFNPATESFTQLPDMAVYRAAHTATLLADGRVLLTGGNGTDRRAEVFDPGTDTFTTLSGEMRLPRRGHTATRLEGGFVLLMGGGDRSAELFVSSQELFRWSNGYPIAERKDHTANFTPGGRILFTGGSYTNGIVVFFNNSTEIHNPDNGVFLGSPHVLDAPKTRHRATTLSDGRILITGGSNLDPALPELRSVEIYEED